MITENKIMELVKQYAKTPEGKRKILEKYGLHYDENFTYKDYMKFGNQMKTILFNHTNRLIKSIQLDDIVVEEPTIDANGKMAIKISFKESSLKRDSLYIDGYPEGLENIVLLFAHGYEANNYAYGYWLKPGGRGTTNYAIRGKKSREPNDFLYDAIEEFNNIANGIAVATLENEYK